MDTLEILGILLLIAGFILVGIEMILPGFSVPGICAIICLVTAVFLMADSIMEGVAITVMVLALLGILLALILWLLSRGKLKPPIILEEEQKRSDGYLSSSDLNYLLGKEGVAGTDLRPAGVGRIDGVNLDVMSDGRYISRGTKIRIIKVEGSKLIVEEEA